MLHRLVLLAVFCGLLAQAAPAAEGSLEKKVVLVASPPHQRLDGDKKVYEILRPDVFVNVKWGTKDNSPNVTAIVTLESTAPSDSGSETGPTTSWAYGTSCSDGNCPDAAKRYDQSGQAGKAISYSGFTGTWYTDSITVGTDAKIKTDFVALSQRYGQESNDGGLLSLGIGASHQTVDQLFAIGKDPWITIYTGTSADDGRLVIGRNGHDKCNSANMWTITNGAWEVDGVSIEVDNGNKKDKLSLGFSITQKNIKIPSDSYDIVTKDANPDNSGVVNDISKLKTIKITSGSTSWTLKPEDITFKDSVSGKYTLLLQKSPDSNPAITLGVPFLKGRCLVLNGADTDKTKWQVGVGDPKSGAGVFGLSALLLSVVSVFHFLRL